MEKKKYKVSELQVMTYGSGRKKRFIIYTDYKETPDGPWHTRVYPDTRGNMRVAVGEALLWLNVGEIGEPWVVRNKPSKYFISYNWGR